MNKDITFSEACEAMAEIIQTGDEYIEVYGSMISAFITAQEEGETNRMSLALAKKRLED